MCNVLKRDHWIGLALLFSFGCAARQTSPKPSQTPDRPPNIVIIFTDDQGYGDVGAFGATDLRTPELDRLAREGMRLTSFYVAQAVCSASRAALLTGSYPNRIGIEGALMPNSKTALNHAEKTIAEVVKEQGYRTGMFGKWHLGDSADYLPTHHGFDEYYGLPYSNDMWPKNPVANHLWTDLPLIEGEKVIELNPDQSALTTNYTKRAVDFIVRNAASPFLLYLAHSMPHVPLFVSSANRGRSTRGLYGDVIEEIDWSVGQVMAALRKAGLADNTLVFFTSDNGPWLAYGNHGGSAGPLREGKQTTFEGGMREPAIVWWPGHVPANTISDEMVLSMDILPTIARLTGGTLPPHKIDGKDVWPIFSGQADAQSPHEAFYYYWIRDLQAVRRGRWKLHLPHQYKTVSQAGADGVPGKTQYLDLPLSLFDLDADIGETTNVAEQNPEVVAELMALADKARNDLGDGNTPATGARPPGQQRP